MEKGSGAAKLVWLVVVLVPLLYLSTCSVISSRRVKGFDAVSVGDTKQQVLILLGTPSVREKSGGEHFARYGAKVCSAPCAERFWFETGTSVTLFVYDESGHLLGEYDASGNLIEETVWMGDVPIATLRPNGTGVSVYYIHTDHLNTPRRISRPADNVIVWRWDSEPFGAAAANQDPDGDGTAFVYNPRFPGQYYDVETGLNYNYHRDYDPTVGRYIESDPTGLSAGINTYGYAYNDPIGTIDSSGLSAFKIIKLCAEGYKVIKEVGFKQAVQALRRGDDVLAPSTKQARKVANSASDAGSPIRDPAHQADYMKHYHPNPRTGGHAFYSVAAALTISHYVQCSDCVAADLAAVGDFFNPLSLPEDAIEIYDTVTSP